MTYTMKDLEGIVDGPLTHSQEAGVLAYVNDGVMPPFDSCVNCEPAFIRKLISQIQFAEIDGRWPPKKVEVVEDKAETKKTKPRAPIQINGGANG